MPARKLRLDLLLVERGLFPTRAKAQAALMAGAVRVPGHQRPKAGLELPADAPVELAPNACPFVSRGGLKLRAALEGFRVRPEGRACLDLGSSTGGFTDCLLQAGARLVYAVDVGTRQLDSGLRADSRVRVLEGTHARELQPGMFDPTPDLAVVDVSFISLTKVLPFLPPCLAPGFELVALIKPQFELGPKQAPKGVVRLAGHREQAVSRVRACAAALGLEQLGFMESPLRGAKGNAEFLLHCRGKKL